MKRLIFILIVLFAAGTAYGQTTAADSLEFRPGATVDSVLVGQSIFDLLAVRGTGAEVTVRQSPAILSAMQKHIAGNASRPLSGYRIRIYFDNHQNARGAAEAAMHRFIAAYPDIAAYQSYKNPFFQVTVGDFRTRSEAMEALQSIRNLFPTASIIKEKINFPPAGPVGTTPVLTHPITL